MGGETRAWAVGALESTANQSCSEGVMSCRSQLSTSGSEGEEPVTVQALVGESESFPLALGSASRFPRKDAPTVTGPGRDSAGSSKEMAKSSCCWQVAPLRATSTVAVVSLPAVAVGKLRALPPG